MREKSYYVGRLLFNRQLNPRKKYANIRQNVMCSHALCILLFVVPLFYALLLVSLVRFFVFVHRAAFDGWGVRQ